jgi:hypothetical protein
VDGFARARVTFDIDGAAHEAALVAVEPISCNTVRYEVALDDLDVIEAWEDLVFGRVIGFQVRFSGPLCSLSRDPSA